MFTSLGPLFIFLFLPVFFLAYLAVKPELRPALIIIASIIFIGWGQGLALISIGGLLVLTYGVGRLIEKFKATKQSTAFWFLGVGLAANLAALAVFKALSAGWLFRVAQLFDRGDPLSSPVAGFVAFVGISYITLQLIGYLIDIWRGVLVAEKNIVSFAGYIFFFPKLVSGPLIRYKPFAAQFASLSPSTDQMAAGFRRILLGFIKRALIANALALVANAAFDLPSANLEPRWAWLGLLAFALQIFYDFAGYSDMAIGLGLLLGLNLPENFDAPYLARSVSDFWRRWHMSLTTWFREYVFFPLERKRLPWLGQPINILLVFLLTGLWHGFQLTYIAWGLWHGLAIAFESIGLGRRLKSAWRPLQHIYTLLIVLVGWVFFRSGSLAYAFTFFSRLAGNTANLTILPFTQTTPLPILEPSFVLAVAVALIFIFPVAMLWQRACARWSGNRPLLSLGFQVFEDAGLVSLFCLGLAAVVSGHFLPNLYAKF